MRSTSYIPKIPKELLNKLFKPCPFWPEKKTHETHKLVLIPANTSVDDIKRIPQHIDYNHPKIDYFNLQSANQCPRRLHRRGTVPLIQSWIEYRDDAGV